MKLAIDEQVLTAYALDELPIQHRIEVKAYLATHPDAAAEVEAIRAMAGQLTAELSAEAASFSSIKKPAVPALPMKIRRSRRVEAMLAIAASVALVGGAAVVMIRSTSRESASISVALDSEPTAWNVRKSLPLQPGPPMPEVINANVSGKSIVDQLANPQAELSASLPNRAFHGATTPQLGSPAAPATPSGTSYKQTVTSGVEASIQFEAGSLPNVGLAVSPATPAGNSSAMKDSFDNTIALGRPPMPMTSTPALQPAVTIGGDAKASNGGSYRFASPTARSKQGVREKSREAVSEFDTDAMKGIRAVPVRGDDREHNTEAYDRIVDNAFLSAQQNPLSTFSIDVDTASYSNLRRFLTQGQLPPKDAVRIEEMVNYFPYRYEGPKDGDKPFAASVEVAGCPWSPAHRLVRVAIKGKEIAPKDRPASNLVFLIDVSGSMNEPNKLPLVKESMRKLVNKLDARDRVAMVVYAGNSGLVLPSTTIHGPDWSEQDAKERIRLEEARDALQAAAIGANPQTITQLEMQMKNLGSKWNDVEFRRTSGRQTILDAIDCLEAGGSTNGGAGIELAYLTAQSGFIKDGINRVILATDGDFNVGVTDQGSLTRLIEDKAKGGTFLSVLGFGMGNTKDSTMEKLADKGNGNYAYIDTAKEAQKVLVEQMSGTLVTIAKDVKIQVEFNPAKVGSYRLIGYENRILAKEDFNNDLKDAGEIGAGHTVTALYEVAPFSELTVRPAVDPLKYQKAPDDGKQGKAWAPPANSNDLLTLKIRYKAPDAPLEQGTSKLLEFPITDDGKGYEKASEDFKFAAAVASFGMILRNSEYKGTSSYDAAIEMAQEGKGLDANGYRAELIELIKKAKAIGEQ